MPAQQEMTSLGDVGVAVGRPCRIFMASEVVVTVAGMDGSVLLHGLLLDPSALTTSLLERLHVIDSRPSRFRLITASGQVLENTSSPVAMQLTDDDITLGAAGEFHVALQALREDPQNTPDANDNQPVLRANFPNFHCCIVSSVDASGDGCGPPPCCYLAFCGPVLGSHTGEKYACCFGCNLHDVRQCQRLSRPLCECPCPLICWVWPVLWPLGLCMARLTGGKAVHAGECCFNCQDCCPCVDHRGDWSDNLCFGPKYNRDDWYDEEAMCTPIVLWC